MLSYLTHFGGHFEDGVVFYHFGLLPSQNGSNFIFLPLMELGFWIFLCCLDITFGLSIVSWLKITDHFRDHLCPHHWGVMCKIQLMAHDWI